MIPGPIEISARVQAAAAEAPRSHVAPDLIEAFGWSIAAMRDVWKAADDSQPFVVAGSGTLAMEMAVANLVSTGDRVVVANSGYFSDRIAEMLRRTGAEVVEVKAPVGHAPAPNEVEAVCAAAPTRALFATHVDTSTGVRVDAEALCAVARRHDALAIFDGVCATAGERFEMAAWDADVYLTASQKAIGLPAGLALLVASARAMERRRGLASPPPLSIDWLTWLPIMAAYEERRPSYFATPATTLIWALRVGLEEILADGIDARLDAHARTAEACRRAWGTYGLTLLPEPTLAANTLSAIRYPVGCDASLVDAIKRAGVVVAPGLHPDAKDAYFRVGHMGDVITRPEDIARTVAAVGQGLRDVGRDVDPDAAVAALTL